MCKNDKRKMYKADDLEWWSELIETAQRYAGNMTALAENIKDIAHTEYGSTSTSITPRNIERWSTGDRLFPLWARLAVLHYCKDCGWHPTTAEDYQISYTLWAKGREHITPQSFASDFNIPVSETLKFT